MTKSLLTIIPVFNGERYLGETLRSVAGQTHRPDRMVIVDDGSTDGTQSVVKDFQRECPDLPVEWRPNPRNLGLFPNLNRCLEAATEADYLHLLLADDLIQPEFYSRTLSALADCPAPSFAYTLASAIDQDSKPLRDIGAAPVADARKIPQREFIRRQCELQTVFCGSLVVKTGGRPLRTRFPTDFPQVGDCVYYAELAGECRELIELGARLTLIRIHTTSATARNARNLNSFVLDEWRAMERIVPLLAQAPLSRWLYQEQLRLRFAARTVVKEQIFAASGSEHAARVRELGLPITGPVRWQLGRLAVWLRDRVAGRPTY